jgi:hypothetical protein
MVDNIENVTLEILKTIQQDQTIIKSQNINTRKSVEDLRVDMSLQLTAINERLSGQFIGEVQINKELERLQLRIRNIEKQLDINQT